MERKQFGTQAPTQMPKPVKESNFNNANESKHVKSLQTIESLLNTRTSTQYALTNNKMCSDLPFSYTIHAKKVKISCPLDTGIEMTITTPSPIPTVGLITFYSKSPSLDSVL